MNIYFINIEKIFQIIKFKYQENKKRVEYRIYKCEYWRKNEKNFQKTKNLILKIKI